MKRMIVDKNLLESDELRAWLSQSKDNFAVITDYAQLEALKGNALVNILKSTEVISEFPKQVLILKPIAVISGMKGKRKGQKKRFTSGRATRAFRKWCIKTRPGQGRRQAASTANYQGWRYLTRGWGEIQKRAVHHVQKDGHLSEVYEN
jgi:hypothetical protein